MSTPLELRSRTCRWSCYVAVLLLVLSAVACGEEDTVQGQLDQDAGVDSSADSQASGKACKVKEDCPAATAPCQSAQCHPSLGCLVVAVPDGTICSDGNACTSSDLCLAGSCKPGSAAECSDGDPCTIDSCDSAKGCQHGFAPDGTACSDDDPCTDADSCTQGKCAAGKGICGCKSNADCQDDGNLCNGVPYCDKSNPAAPKCQTNPATVVYCPGGFDTACLKNACEPSSGTCTPTPIELAVQVCTGANSCIWLKNQGGAPVPKVIPCDDGDSCTAVDECKNGSCQPGANNVCGCQNDAACAGQDDGNFCNGTLYCDKSEKPAKCKINPATVVSCPTVDDTFCQVTECNPKLGKCEKVYAHQKQSCDDQNGCTSGETCQNGQCKSAANTCICTQDSDCATKEDGDLCNGVLYCNKQSGVCEVNPATVVSCPTADNTACQQNLCQAKTGQCAMTAMAEGGPCSDGNACTDNDHCAKGQCVGTAACECSKDSDCGAKEDGDLCNGTLYCKSGKCEINPASTVKCSNSFDTVCLQNQCDKGKGACQMVPANQGVACSDGDPCTASETCQLGQCKAGSNLCECQNNQDCQAKDDGNFCNGTLYCNKAAAPYSCAVNPATVVKCPSVDDTFCASSLCQPKTGLCELSPVHQGFACDDGNKCSDGDLCKNGNCSGEAKNCSDDTACTADTCDPLGGCKNSPQASLCDDQDACTSDSCSALTGCIHKAITGACDDGSPCTSGDVCGSGGCVGKPVVCEDKNPCTDDTCDAAKGCVSLPNAATCSTGQACTPLGQCGGGKCAPLPSPLGTAILDGVGADKPAQLLAKELNAAWLIGSTASGAKGASDVWLVKLGADGAVAGELLVGAEGEESAAAAATVSGGGALAVGAVKPGPLGGQDAFLVRFGADGAVVWKQVAGGPGDDAALAVAVFGKDEAWVAGSSAEKGVVLPWVARVSAVGTVMWQKPLPGAAGAARAVAAVAGGGAWLAGERLDPAGKPTWWAARLAADGKILWEGGLSALTGSANAVVALADGGALLAGWQGAGFEDARAVRVDAAGKVGWDKLFGGAGGAWFGQLSAADAQTVRFAGQRELDGNWHAWVGALDLGGQPVWDRTPAMASSGGAVTATPLTNGYLMLAAAWADATTKGAAVRIVRADPWGYPTCQAQGDCSGKGPWDCDDANPCTNDTCSALLGCSHQLNTLGCDDGNPCTENDLCEAGQCGGDGQGTCDDGNPCTQDLCSASGGCSHAPLTSTCSDGNLCTLKDQCVGGFCKPGLLDGCDDGNQCSDDSCAPSKGCLHLPNNSDCESGNCTYADACIQGACVSSGKAGFVDQWYGTAVAERPRKLAQIGQDGFWMVGETYELSTPDGYLVRTDANGTALTKQVFKPPFGSGNHADVFTGVVATPFGAMIAGSTGTCFQRGWIVRVDPAGKEVWSKGYSHDGGTACNNGQNTGAFHDIADGNDGSWTAVGWRHGWPWSNDVQHAWALRVDKDGAVLNSTLLYTGAAIFYGVAPMGGQGYAAVGATDQQTAGGWDAIASRLNGSTSAIWNKKYGGIGNDYLVEANAAPDGGVYAVGRSNSTGAGNDDGWVVRLDVNGAIIWQRYLGGAQNDGFSSVAVMPGGDVVVGGYTYSKGKGSSDLWLVSLDGGGNVQWERVQGTASDDVINSLIPLTGSGLAAAAYGSPPKASAHDFRLLVLDSFGHFSCIESGSCFGKPLHDCDDDQLCTADDCSAASGCTATAATWACSDGDACTGSDQCKGGVCSAGAAVVCDDKNPCTKDSCDSAKGCVGENLANGSPCGTGKTCTAGVCK